jgi:hypothetical protein
VEALHQAVRRCQLPGVEPDQSIELSIDMQIFVPGDFAFHMEIDRQTRHHAICWRSRLDGSQRCSSCVFSPTMPVGMLSPGSFADLSIPSPQLAVQPVSSYPTSDSP